MSKKLQIGMRVMVVGVSEVKRLEYMLGQTGTIVSYDDDTPTAERGYNVYLENEGYEFMFYEDEIEEVK